MKMYGEYIKKAACYRLPVTRSRDTNSSISPGSPELETGNHKLLYLLKKYLEQKYS